MAVDGGTEYTSFHYMVHGMGFLLQETFYCLKC